MLLFVVHATQILLVRRPPKEIDSPDQAPAIFEFAVVGGAAGASDTSSQAESRLSYFLSGPGAKHEWRAVPVVPRDEWAARLANSSEEGKGEESGGDFVWGLALENLDDGEYRLQVRHVLCVDGRGVRVGGRGRSGGKGSLVWKWIKEVGTCFSEEACEAGVFRGRAGEGKGREGSCGSG